MQILLYHAFMAAPMSTFENESIKKILERYRRIWAIGHAQSVLGWDMEVNMPKQGIQERSVAQGELSVMSQELMLNPEFVKLIENIDYESLNETEKGVIRVLRRDLKISRAFPPDFVREMSETTSRATMAWQEAKKKDDFSIFESHLDKIMSLAKRAADYLGYEKQPYDALLDLFEEGLTTDDVERMFSEIERPLRDALDKILDEGKFPKEHPLERKSYDESSMREVNIEILKALGYPLGERSRIDVSAHPFTTEFGLNDVRITTRYEGYDFKMSLLSTVHEFGHALYELQQNPEFMMTPIIGGVSLGIHESQSRFWENMIGRSMPFVRFAYPILKKHLSFVSSYTPEDLYLYLNTVRPDLIRTEASEVTYNLHIILRFKLEKLMVNEGVKASELPELWNEEMDNMLGVRPKSYADGILQDIHWSHGTIGYFPTYSIGTLFAAQIGAYAEREIDDFNTLVESGNFQLIREYLREKVHKFGKIYPPKELVKRSFGEEIEPKYFINYILKKYLS